MKQQKIDELPYKEINYSEKVCGLLCGRFQPLHYGHFEFIDIVSKYVDYIYIGITNPDINSINVSQADLSRSNPQANIFSFEERKEMVDKLMGRYFPYKEWIAMPFNLNNTNELVDKLPNNLIIMNTIYDDWGEEKNKLFVKTGKTVHVLWRRTEKITTASNVRYWLMQHPEDHGWVQYVPPTTQEVIKRIGIAELKRRYSQLTNAK